jgi:hypothetical protein
MGRSRAALRWFSCLRRPRLREDSLSSRYSRSTRVWLARRPSRRSLGQSIGRLRRGRSSASSRSGRRNRQLRSVMGARLNARRVDPDQPKGEIAQT